MLQVDIRPTAPVVPENVEPNLSGTPPAIEQPNVIPPNVMEDNRVQNDGVDVYPPSSTPNRLKVERYDPSFKSTNIEPYLTLLLLLNV